MAENNISITGDQARILMAALRTSQMPLPIGPSLDLYLTLVMISQVQPPVVQSNQEASNNEVK